MTPDRILVTLLGLATIAFVVWFFWLRRTAGARAAVSEGGVQEALVVVKGGYTPDTIVVQAGRPVRLNFRRDETASCSEVVLFPAFHQSADLPAGRIVAVEFTPPHPGTYAFACRMGMLQGRVIAQ